jgi:hypothetical protein
MLAPIKCSISNFRSDSYLVTEDSTFLVYVDAQTARQRLNALDYYGDLQKGLLTPLIVRDVLANASFGLPVGTGSQTVYYMRGQTRIAVVHQFLLPDGTLGASGLPDPKWLRDGTRILAVR